MAYAGATRALGLALALAATGIATDALVPHLALAGRGDPARGRLLVATHQVGGPFFPRTVVLLLDYDENGAIGLVINRPTEQTLSGVVEDVEGRDDPIFLGGPVAIHTSLTLLVRSDEALDGALPVVDDVYATGSAEVLHALLASGLSSTRLRVYRGYAGWAPGQLDHEIARGDWHLTRSRSELIFETGAAEIWPKLIRENDGREVRRIAPDPTTRVSLLGDALDVAPRAFEDGADLVHDLRVAVGPGDRP